MRYRKLTPEGDYSFGAGQLDFWRDVPEAVGQAAATRLRLWIGEWFLNIEEGTPYMLSVLGKHTQTEADVTLQDRILQTQGMVDIEEFESEINAETRGMIVNAIINTIYGPTSLQVQSYVNY